LVTQFQNVFILDFVGAKGDGAGGNNWSYKMCKLQSSSQNIITNKPAPIFYRLGAVRVTEPTVSKH